MNIIHIKIAYFFLVTGLFLLFPSCDNVKDTEDIPNAPYVMSLGITSGGTTTYYVVGTNDLMKENINAKGKGIEQAGYHDYAQGSNTVFSIGGLGVNYATGIIRNEDGYLEEKGNFAFNTKLSAFQQVDNNTMLGMEIPKKPVDGNQILFYIVDINNVAITKTIERPIAPIAEVEWPSITGMCRSENNIYITYIQMSPNAGSETKFVDTTYVAVYSYPDMNLQKIMKDTRTGPAGSWTAYNGIFTTETGDMYVMSNTSMANGFSKLGKNAAFLRIPKGGTDFDSNYFFDFETKSGGLKPAHIHYIGDGLLFAEVSTLNPQTVADRWSDKNLKCCIIDLYNQTITDVEGIPIHPGAGGRRFAAITEGEYVYFTLSNENGTYIYRVHPKTATAVRGAKVSTTFIAGFFKVN